MIAAIPGAIPEVLDVELFGEGEPILAIEVPHGATRTRDYADLAARLRSPLPDGLVDFFYVNTDTGAPELAPALAERVVAAHPGRSVVFLRCRIPRTFIDCNRRIDASAADFKAGGVAPGLMPWIVDPDDIALLRDRYDRYVAATRAAFEALPADGAVLLLHSYAPRTVGVEVDLNIVASLHAAYAPGVVETWPLRPELDVIALGPDGTVHAPPAVVMALRDELGAAGMALGDSHAYSLHPSTMGYEHVTRRPGRGLCLEVRRDLFVERFEPFVEAAISPAKVTALADPIARALLRWWPAEDG